MADRLIPVDATVAAKRAFVRTAAQSLASVIPTAVVDGGAPRRALTPEG